MPGAIQLVRGEQAPGRRLQPPVWFALDDDRSLAFFAGIWCRHRSVRRLKEVEVEVDVFGFLTMEANAEVGAVHPKAMPVILTTADELDQWMVTPTPEAMRLCSRMTCLNDRIDG